jgi:hypothetical protein
MANNGKMLRLIEEVNAMSDSSMQTGFDAYGTCTGKSDSFKKFTEF